ncbi:uncharacterized protein LOC133183376 [Saccostrea echinata]|uniref:uncharacterized protein LOC133183376 n=1 Tax=Saccostrea echinata TaxID=191078 RepID=UPI002A803AC0|nr:uncharacterized protein LOC133183376 [Saccostrea echinata]
MKFCSDLVKVLVLALVALKNSVYTDDGSCSALGSKSIHMNEDILEFIDNNQRWGKSQSKLKECSKNSFYQNGKEIWSPSHMNDRRGKGLSIKKKEQRRLKGSKRMRKIKKKRQRWKRHKQKMR